MIWILSALGVLVFLRAAYVTATYLLYWYEAAQEGFLMVREAGPMWVAALRALVGYLFEICASVLVLLAYPARIFVRDRPGPPGEKRPLLLVHGMYVNGGALFLLKRRLAAAGWTSIYLLDLDFRRGHIAALSDQVIARVEEILVATGADRVDALGHSLGGVVIFHTLLRGGGERSLGTCLALGAPFHGTRMANFSSSPLLRQFAPGSPMLGDLCAKLEAPGAVSSLTRLVSIWSNYDNVVLPNTSAVLPSPPAENIRVDFVGHVSMLFSATVARQVERVLAGSI